LSKKKGNNFFLFKDRGNKDIFLFYRYIGVNPILLFLFFFNSKSIINNNYVSAQGKDELPIPLFETYQRTYGYQLSTVKIRP
jgi:hypothetical protein